VSRGIDISHVSHVVSYDAPIDIRKYIHRVGRTARAGRAGNAWTLVEEQEVRKCLIALQTLFDSMVFQARYFKSMMKDAEHLDRVKRLRVTDQELRTLVPHYEVGKAYLVTAVC
jgi:ATP-dependent RNA helicase DDX51/DBP6